MTYREDLFDTLTEREKTALTAWRGLKKELKEEIPLKTALQMYDLYLNGYNCEEIEKINNNIYRLGAIIDARLKYDWDGMKERHLTSLFDGIKEKVKQTQAESVAFITDLLQVAHKQHGTRLKKFLQSGDERDLGEFAINSLATYKNVAETLLKLTGQDQKKEAAPKLQIIGEKISIAALDSPEKKKAGDFAKNVLALLESNKDGEKED